MNGCPNGGECGHGSGMHEAVSTNTPRYVCVVSDCDCGRGEGLFAPVGASPVLPDAAMAMSA